MNQIFRSFLAHRKAFLSGAAGTLLALSLLFDNQVLWFLVWVGGMACFITACIVPNKDDVPDENSAIVEAFVSPIVKIKEARKQQEETNKLTAPDSIWPDEWMDFKPEDKKWYMEQMQAAGYEFDEFGDRAPQRNPHLEDLGKPFPHDEVGSSTRRFKCFECEKMKLESKGFEILPGLKLRCHDCIEEREHDILTKRYHGECHHTGGVETTTMADRSRTHVCADCGKQLGYTTPEVEPETDSEWTEANEKHLQQLIKMGKNHTTYLPYP
jgi:hypothetical protein